MPSPRYTRSQVASLLHIAPKTLYNWEREGKIVPPHRDRRGWRWYTEEQVGAMRAMVGPIVAAGPAAAASSPPAAASPLVISARNCLRGTVKSILEDGVTAEVVIDLGHGQEIVAVITRGSVERLGLRVGEPAAAVIKATEVIVAR